jgi:prefoldin subunit 5
MENTKVTLNELEAFVSKLGTLVDSLESDIRELEKKSLDITQKIQKTETTSR